MTQRRLFGFALICTVMLGIASCGDDDEQTDGASAPSADLAQYCELSQELDQAGTEAFEELEEDPKATAQDFAQAEADLVEQVGPTLDEIVVTAPEDIRPDVEVLVASVRARGGQGKPPDEEAAAEAEATIQQFEKENCRD